MNNVLNKLTLFIFVFISIEANAGLISSMGGLDNFIESADLGNSGTAVEEAWVESILNVDVTIDDKYNSNGGNWTLADDLGNTDVYFLEMNTSPEYFLLKLGTGGTSLDSHFLFENVGDLNFAVVDFSQAGIDFTVNNISIDRMSHFGEINGYNEVPEPTALFLLSLALLGFAFKRKKETTR